jgi:putative nucleotidyltransferase with HDIG domain
MNWPHIKFQFKEAPLDEVDILPVGVHIIESIYDAAHRIEEMLVIKRYLHSGALVFERGSLIDPKEISLNSGETAVFNLVNGDRRISQIIEDSAKSINDVYRHMMTLVSIGLIDLAGQDESQKKSKTNAAANSVGNLKEKIISNIRELPPMLKIALKAREIIANPSFNFKEICTVIEKDQGMASQILKTANSAYYGLTGQVSSVKHASVVLGYRILEEIILSTSAKGHFDKPLEGYQLNQMESWQHSLTVAFAAKALATEIKPALENDAFTIGLFHDIGKIPLNPYMLQHQTSFQEALEKKGTTVADVERQLFGFDHAQLGSELCIRWNFPKTITDAIKNHHSPPQSVDDELTYILYIVNILNKKDLSGSADQILDGIDPDVTAKLNIEADMLKRIHEKAFEAFGKIAGEK